MNCKHCGSKYTEQRGKTEDFGKVTYQYYCQSCKKYFDYVVEQKQASGQWLMTFRGNERFRTYRDVAEIYKKENGTFEINQKNDEKCLFLSRTPKLLVKHNTSLNKYYLWYDSFQSLNDPNGTFITIEEIELNPELTQKALQNDAMKAIHDHGNIFKIKSQLVTTLLNDVEAWLIEAMGIPQATSGGCYVATCVYGSYDCPEVWTLRRFRDNTLALSWHGRTFIRLYYTVSPTLVKLFGETSWFRRFWKRYLDKAVAHLQAKGVESTRYYD